MMSHFSLFKRKGKPRDKGGPTLSIYRRAEKERIIVRFEFVCFLKPEERFFRENSEERKRSLRSDKGSFKPEVA